MNCRRGEALMERDTRRDENRPEVDAALLVARIAVGLILAVHGAQKLFGWFGGEGQMAGILQLAGPQLGWLVAIGECFGGLGLILGILPRFSALANIVIQIGAIVLVHGKHGFFLQNQGFEYNLALIGLLSTILIAGPGLYSLSEAISMPKASRARRRRRAFE
jgi:putative oxidoreductase